MNAIELQLDKAREDLLDLSLRNKLLNYRQLKGKGVDIVDERPEEIFRILVVDGQVMSFLARPEEEERAPETDVEQEAGATPAAEVEADVGTPVAPAPGEEPEIALEQPEEVVDEESETGSDSDLAARYRDRQLQTAHPSARLQKRLLNTYYSARTYIEEQGVNILYLALGMLNWYEAPASETVRQAPLILVPVELYRTNVRTRFRLRHTEEEIGSNLSLQAKLKVDFGIELPSLNNGDELDVHTYFDAVGEAIRPFPCWTVERSAIALGFFSFGTFLMYNDLDTGHWPQAENPADHPLLQAILEHGFHEPPPEVVDGAFVDDYVTPEGNFQVVDADSSQTLAILDVNQGRNLVIQGPPGTGKSQTITNLIAESLGQGKRVLFVAEKMAALEVVKRRLDNAGLGAACLELHSHKTNKKAFLAELQRTLELGEPKLEDYQADLQALLHNRDHLNRYSRAVNTPVGESGVTPYQAYGRLLRLQQALAEVEPPTLPAAPLAAWDGATFRRWLEKVEAVQAHLGQSGVPVAHPFWGSQFTSYFPADRRAVRQACQVAGRALYALQQSAQALAQHLQMAVPKDRAEAIRLSQTGEMALAAPSLAGVDIVNPAWRQQLADIREALAKGARLASLHEQYDPLLIPEAWKQEVLPLRATYANYQDKWWRFLSGEFRRARHALTGLAREALPKAVEQQMALVEAILEAQRLEPALAESEPLLVRLFGSHWQGLASDWSALAERAEWLIARHEQVAAGVYSPQLLHYLAGTPDKEKLGPLVAETENALDRQGTAAAGLVKTLKLDEKQRFGEDQRLLSQPFTGQQHLLQTWYEEVDRLDEMVTFNHQARGLRQGGLGRVSTIAAVWPGAARHLTHLFQRTWYEMLLARAVEAHPILAHFSRETQQHRIERFRESDRLTFQINRTQLAHQHWRQLPRVTAGGGQLGILQREFAKKRRHLPIRRLMEQAGHVVQTLKPVFMMSPLSIAQFLPPGTVDFDLVIFDEASQVRPVEAFGAILRGKQAVVVGDNKQLPPTDFFNQLVEADEEEESPTADLESVLGLFSAQGAPQRMLRWHYRSEHESLIAVSNHEFYDNRLLLFPSPFAARQELGLVFHHLPYTVYDRGRSRSNRREALAVAEAVMEHARNRPELTLGVAAFSVSQMQAVQDQLELLRRQDPECEHYFNAHPHEPFFIKNLENVQGDERDVIFISVGYGRDHEGRVSMNFGPINKDGGERRLNVLTTRARRRCEIFTNITDEDIDLSRTDARGVRVLKRYLKYARTGLLEVPAVPEQEADGLFEEVVADALREAGYPVDYRVGTAGFFIDLAVRDEARPGRYLLGIECDGASYHNARSARDRDRLRQQVLEAMGWQIHRIWSTDWFRNPQRELRRTIEAIEAARTETVTARPEANETIVLQALAPPGPIARYESEGTVSELQAADYTPSALRIRTQAELYDVPTERVAGWIERVVAVESPVHAEDVARRIIDAAGVGRMGSRIRAALDAATEQAVAQGLVQRRGEFLWKNGERRPEAVRSHANLPEYARRLEQIAPEEIMLAVEQVVESTFGMEREEIPAAVCALFGFGRTSQAMRAQVDELIAGMLAEELLAEKGSFIMVANQ